MDNKKIEKLLLEVVQELKSEEKQVDEVDVSVENTCECTSEEENEVLKYRIEELESENEKLKDEKKELQFRIEKYKEKVIQIIEK